MVLGRVLGFALASQIFGSEDVARACRVDAVVKGLCEERAPFAHEVMRFRRKNRPLLERLLTEIFTRAVVHHFGLDPVVLPPELKQDLRQHAKERLDLARLMDLE